MLGTRAFGARLRGHGYGFFSGVPCSYLTSLIDWAASECAYVGAVNEGDAVAHCAGAWLGGTKAVVLMQNSGLTNALSPLTSLNPVFGIPVLGFVSLRVGTPEEPQHEVMGRATTGLLDAIGLPWAFLATEAAEAARQLAEADVRIAIGESFFFVVRKDTFDAYVPNAAPLPRRAPVPWSARARAVSRHPPRRADALRTLAEVRGPRTVVVTTTGYTSREMYALADDDANFYMVGSLGCVSALALGLALVRPDVLVVAVDGDGALLLRLGALATNGTYGPANLLHLLLDNACHESTGAQPTVAGNVEFVALAVACGMTRAFDVADVADLRARVDAWQRRPEPTFIHLRTAVGTAAPLVRPAVAPPDAQERFRRHLARIADRS